MIQFIGFVFDCSPRRLFGSRDVVLSLKRSSVITRNHTSARTAAVEVAFVVQTIVGYFVAFDSLVVKLKRIRFRILFHVIRILNRINNMEISP